MSSTTITILNSKEIVFLIIGAVLAIVGGILGDEIRSSRENKRELKSIKTTIGDELGEIEATVTNMHEVWVQAKVLPQNYVANLQGDTTAFDNLRMRLFLIEDENLRKDIISFYKKLKDTCKNSKGKIGTLADTDEARGQQANIDSEFQKLGSGAKSIKERLGD